MDVYLAGVGNLKSCIQNGLVSVKGVKVLESFYDCRSNQWLSEQIPTFGKFLLDSGAFTFLNTKTNAQLDWDKYVDAYSDFIVANNVKHFFELDIDPIVGIKGVERLRNRIERRTQLPTIPVWHINRGKDYFVSLCKNYNYIAIGGLVTSKSDKKRIEKYLPWFITTAHKHKCKIHGLGYTSTAKLSQFHFDSVDSTSWKVRARIGFYSKFDLKTHSIVTQYKKENQRIKDYKQIYVNDFKEWVKFQHYADKYL